MLHRIARARSTIGGWSSSLWVLALVAAIVVGPDARRQLREQRPAFAHRLAGRVRRAGPRLPAAARRRGPDRVRRHPTRPARDRRVPEAGSARAGRDLGGVADGVARAGTSPIVPITTANGDSSHPARTADRIQALAQPLARSRVSTCSSPAPGSTKVSMPASEVVGIIAAIVVLLVAFGSLIAMGLPILTALIGIAISLAGVGRHGQRPHHAELRAAGRGDDRHRRRHRLRALHRHPLPRARCTGRDRRKPPCWKRWPRRAVPSCSPGSRS